MIQKKMSKDKELDNLFKSHKKEISDNGFSREVTDKLPQRINILPYLIIALFAALGLILTFSIIGISTFLEEISTLVLSLSKLQVPPPSSLINYIVGLMLLVSLSFAIYKVDADIS